MNNEFTTYFDDNMTGNYLKGKNARNMFTELVTDFFEDFDQNMYIAGQAGVGKTHLVEKIAALNPNVHLVRIEGNMTAFFFAKQIAVQLYIAEMQGKKQIAIYMDDINTLFSKIEMMDMFKIMMDTSKDRFSYNKGLNMGGMEDIEVDAINYWKSKQPDRVGFEVPFEGRVRFIMTMNTPLPTKTDLAKKQQGSDPYIKTANLLAITSRFGDGYENLMLNKEQMWGWIAHVVWTDDTMCEGATVEQRYEMLQFLWDGWEKSNEHSLRFVETVMWKVMKKKPARKDYIARWNRHFTSIIKVVS
jgi:hypothetical protein